MGHWEREEAELLLPFGVVPALKKALRDAHNSVRDDVLSLARQVWVDELRRTRSERLYRDRLDAWYERRSSGGYTTQSAARALIAQDAYSLLESLASTPRQARAVDLDAHPWLRKATTKTTRFSFAEAGIVIDGRTVRYWTAENRDVIDAARSHPVGAAFFAFVDQLDWTRDTGGVMTGNHELHVDAGRGHIGGGGDFLKDWWGPRGHRIAKDDGQFVGDYDPQRRRSSRDPRDRRHYRFSY